MPRLNTKMVIKMCEMEELYQWKIKKMFEEKDKEIDKLNKEKQRLKKYMQLERDIALKREDYEIADVYQKCLDKMKEFKQKEGEK